MCISFPYVQGGAYGVCSFDRYRTSLKGTWKDLPLPASGLVFDLAAHTLDQALILFGRPQKITAQVENLRGVGHPDVDDTVRPPLSLANFSH